MTYEIYRYIFIGGAVLAGIMLVTAILLFCFLHIPRVVGDLTGANARKAIARIRSRNESTGEKGYRSSPVNRERGKVTDRISPSGHQNGTNETTVLETEVLGSGATTVLEAETNVFEIEFEITYIHTNEIVM